MFLVLTFANTTILLSKFLTGILSPKRPFANEIPGAESLKNGVSKTICKRSPEFTSGGF